MKKGKANKISRIIVTFLVAAIIFSLGATAVFGASNNTTGTVDLKDIQRLARDNNSELNLLEEQIELKDKWYDDSLEEKEGESKYEEEMREYITPYRKQLEIKNLKWQVDKEQDEIILSSTKMYYAILNKAAMIENQKKKIERLKKVVENKKKRIEAGVDAQYTLVSDEANLKEAETTLVQLQNEEQNLKIQLNLNIGNEVSAKLDLKKVEIPYTEFKIDDINKKISTALAEYHTISYLVEKQKIDIQERALLESYVDDDLSELERLYGGVDYQSKLEEIEDELLTTKYDIDNEKKNVEAKIRIDYNNILNLQNDVEIKKLSYENAQTYLQVEEAKYRAGQSTQMDCYIAQESVDAALYEYNTAKLNYYIAVESFINQW